MRMMFRAFAKKLFGVRYERAGKNLLIGLIVFWGLYIGGMRIEVVPFILYLMAGTFTAGVMWQALSSEDNLEFMTNLYMLPFEGWKLNLSYIGALGAYTLLTKTWLLLAVIYAVSPWSISEIMGSFLCAANGVVMAACIYSMKKCRAVGFIWAGLLLAVLYPGSEMAAFLLLLFGNLLVGGLFLANADTYSFYRKKSVRHRAKGRHRHSVWHYLIRYLTAHKNYLVNTVIMWCVACILPAFFGQMEKSFVLPVGFAILSLNTPICILLSCDPDLDQAVHFLPASKQAFCVPYCLFHFFCNLIPDAIFMVSFELQIGGITPLFVLTGVCFALLSATGSVLLEWFFPIRGCKIESDLWHHPRKYVVPAAMLLLAGIASLLL